MLTMFLDCKSLFKWIYLGKICSSMDQQPDYLPIRRLINTYRPYSIIYGCLNERAMGKSVILNTGCSIIELEV